MEERSKATQDLQCPAIARSGERCKKRITPGDSFCSQHDPSRAERRRRAASKAGKLSSPYGENADLRRQALEMLQEVRKGKFPPERAYAIASLGNLILNSLRVDLKAREQDEIEK